MTTGMVLGKFLPPHAGHCYLIDFARHYVDRLTVVVGTLEAEPIAGELRYRWMKELFDAHGVHVVHLAEELPQDPAEHPRFWDLWRDALERVLPQSPDLVFASENYGWKLAHVLGAQFVPVDIDRSVMPVSGTAIRKDPHAHWQYLPRCVRSHFLRRVCVFGPESTGKSTLTRQLADHYQTVAVPEYARTLLDSQDGELNPDDIPKIARGQAASEDALAPIATGLLFCDTDCLLTTIWSDWLYGQCPDEVTELANKRNYDLYLLTDVDVPWIADRVRYLPEDRTSFFARCESVLQRTKRRYVILRGGWETRLQAAIKAVDSIL